MRLVEKEACIALTLLDLAIEYRPCPALCGQVAVSPTRLREAEQATRVTKSACVRLSVLQRSGRITKKWCVKFSRTRMRHFYYNPITGERVMELPTDKIVPSEQRDYGRCDRDYCV